MHTSRRLLSLAVAATAALSVAACSGGSSGGGHKLAFIQGVSGDEFYITMQCAIEAEAEKAGATVTTQGPAKFDPSLQKPIVDAVVASRPDAILIAPTDVAAMQAPLQAATRSGIKVVLVDTTLEDPSIAVSRISSDNVGGGAEAFKTIQKLAPNGGEVLVMSNDPGISTADARAKGFTDAASADAKYTVLPVQYGHNEPAESAKVMSAALAAHPNIVGIFATSTFSAEGVATALRQAGKQDQIKVVGFDSGPAQIEQLRNGTVQALVAQAPGEMGSDGVQQAMNALDGKPVEADIALGFHTITKENLDSDGDKWVYKSSC